MSLSIFTFPKNPQLTMKTAHSQYSITNMVYFTVSMRVGKERVIFGSSSLLVSLGITIYNRSTNISYFIYTLHFKTLLCCVLDKYHGKRTDEMRAGTQNAQRDLC